MKRRCHSDDWVEPETPEEKAWKKDWQERCVCELVPGDMIRQGNTLALVIGVSERYLDYCSKLDHQTAFVKVYVMPFGSEPGPLFMTMTWSYNYAVEVHLK